MSKRIHVKDANKLDRYKMGDHFGRRYTVIDKGNDHLIVARTFKNGHVKELSKKIVKINN